MSPPSDRDPQTFPDDEVRVMDGRSDEAENLLEALSSATARDLLAELHGEPLPAAAVADRIDTSVQNVKYHLEQLEAAGAIEVLEKTYSSKGRAMKVYAPTPDPLLVFTSEVKDESNR